LAKHLFYKCEANKMQRNYIGEFEELVLLTVAALNGEGYGARIIEELIQHAGRTASLSAVHISLYRLEEKGLVTSQVGGATADRGGRRKRIYTITCDGMHILQEIKDIRDQLWKLIPAN
jgi:PadR family transcriptional regulator, regulatory protein PadR